IICPASLTDMWEAYNEQFQLNARVLSMGLLRSGASALDGPLCSDRDFVLVDESHNFRHHSSQRYDALQSYLARENRRVCLLTATPRNRAATDVYHQIKLFHPDDVTLLPIDPPNLKEYFREVEAGRRRLQDLLVHVLIRRTRKHILRYYGITDDAPSRPMRELSDGEAVPYLDGRKRAHVLVQGKPSYFPQRKLETLRYSIEETYAGLYDRLRRYLGRPAGASGAPSPGKELTYARYGLWHYVLPECQQVAPYPDLHRAGMNLRGLVRVMLFKRFESSVHAFRRTLERLERIHRVFLLALDKGFVPAGEEAQELLYESDTLAEADLVEQLRQVSDRYRLADFDATRLRAHIDADRKLIREMLRLVRPIGPDEDAKLQVLQEKLRAGIPKATGKVLLFTQYAETAQYLFEQINPGGQAKDIDCVFGTQKSKARTAARFAPKANPQIKVAPGDEVRILIATDVMSEGLNLQDGDVVVNYDLHWNPVRLIQRFGRIDRIGSQNDVVWGFNFLPEKALEKQLGLQQVLKGRIKEIHETIGED
ncbi:MAG TPA: DEAD/DEAH box helicase, partial [Chthonomonadales bacterium]|nr:DEAD/DEAH box helicase [Chthonomonadales bacterium]